MHKSFLVILWGMVLLVSPASFADEDQGRIKMLMHTFVLELSKMSPYLASEKAFSSDEGRAVVKSSLMKLESKVQHPPPELKKPTGFRITFGLLADHISKTKMSFEKGQYDYARMQLNGMTNLCVACHTQTPRISANSPFSGFDQMAASKPTFENSNFLFVIRRYDEALAGFNRLVREYPKLGLPSDKLMDVYWKRLAIFARIKRDPEVAIQNLKEDLKNPSLPPEVKQNVLDWIVGFTKWKDEPADPSKLSTAELIAFAAEKIPPALNRKMGSSDPQLLNLLRMSGLLYERLYSEDDPKTTPKLLYYLAVCERSLAPLQWYSLNEIYLKECVVRFPKQEFSKKCYDAYRTGMEERFRSGAMPDYVKSSLDALKEYL